MTTQVTLFRPQLVNVHPNHDLLDSSSLSTNYLQSSYQSQDEFKERLLTPQQQSLITSKPIPFEFIDETLDDKTTEDILQSQQSQQQQQQRQQQQQQQQQPQQSQQEQVQDLFLTVPPSNQLESDVLFSYQQHPEHTHITISPRYIRHSNAITILFSLYFINLLLNYAQKMIDYYYLKSKYDISPSTYSLFVTVTSLTRGATTLLLVPLLQRIFKHPRHHNADTTTPSLNQHSFVHHHKNIYIIGAIFMIQAVSFAVLPFTTHLYQFFIITTLGFTLNPLIGAITRSLLINQLSPDLEKNVLSTCSAIEVLIIMINAVLFNVLWNSLKKYSYAIYFVFCALSFLASNLLLLLRDSHQDFNDRIEMTMQFTALSTSKTLLSE
jgi:hypothetical protein